MDGYKRTHAGAETLTNYEKRLERIKTLLDKLPMETVRQRLGELRDRAIDPDTFTKYDPAQIAEHKTDLDRIERRIKRDNEKEVIDGLTEGDVALVAELSEYLIFQGIDRHKWIPYCAAIKTSRYDDVINGVDAVIEYSNEAIAHIGLAVDVSFSKRNLTSKLERARDEIHSGSLASIDYFESEASGNKGELSGIPRVVVVLDVPVIEDLLGTKTPTQHAARWSVISQITLQLERMHTYAKKINPGTAKKIERALTFMSAIYEGLDVEKKYDEADYSRNFSIEQDLNRALDSTFGS